MDARGNGLGLLVILIAVVWVIWSLGSETTTESTRHLPSASQPMVTVSSGQAYLDATKAAQTTRAVQEPPELNSMPDSRKDLVQSSASLKFDFDRAWVAATTCARTAAVAFIRQGVRDRVEIVRFAMTTCGGPLVRELERNGRPRSEGIAAMQAIAEQQLDLVSDSR